MAHSDYYQTLGIARGASQEDINAAYRKQAREFHPDVSKHADAEARFKAIGEAYEVLKDPASRALYDQYGSAWKAVAEGRVDPGAESGVGAHDFGDLGAMFEQFFGGRAPDGGGYHWHAPRRGSDLEVAIRLGVSEAFRGGKQQLSLGLRPGAPSKHLEVNIPAGVRSGQRIRLAGQGHPAPPGAPVGEPAGDLYLLVELASDEHFTLDGNDLIVELWIAPWQAALGASVPLGTLDSEVKLKIPAGTSSGRTIRLRERGYPDGKGGRGDLYAKIAIRVPAALSKEQRELFERLAQLDDARSASTPRSGSDDSARRSDAA